MREIRVAGRVRRVEVGSWTDKNQVVHPQGTVVLDTEDDKLELGLPMNAGTDEIQAMQRLKKGAEVVVLIGIESGKDWRSDPRFSFLDDLTPAAKA